MTSALPSLLREALRTWWESNPGRLSAALAFYSLVSLAPVLVLVVALAGSVLGEQAARGEIVTQASRLVGPVAARLVEDILVGAARQLQAGWLSLAGLTSLAGATAVFAELQGGLNTVWGRYSTQRSLLRILRERLWSFAMVMATGVLLLASLAASTTLSLIARQFRSSFGHPVLVQLGSQGFSLASTTAIFALIYRFLPETRVAWQDVWAGAVASAFLFVLGKYAITLYLGASMFRSVYGAAGSLALLLVWVYYSAQIFYFGAAFTAAYARRLGSGLQPKRRGA